MGREKLSIKTQANKQRNKNQNNYYKKKGKKRKIQNLIKTDSRNKNSRCQLGCTIKAKSREKWPLQQSEDTNVLSILMSQVRASVNLFPMAIRSRWRLSTTGTEVDLPSTMGGAILPARNLPGDGPGGNSKNTSAPLSHVQAVEIRSLELRRADSGELSLITLTGL